MSGRGADRIERVFVGLGMAVVVAAHLAFLAGAAAVGAALLPVGFHVGTVLSPWAALGFWVAGVGFGGHWAARGVEGRWWPGGLAVGTAAGLLAVAVRAAIGGLPGGAEGGLELVLCEAAALTGAALGRRLGRPAAASAVIGRLLATDAFLLFGGVFLICMLVAAGYPGEFQNLARAEAWLLALLSGLPAVGALLALRVTGDLRRSLLRRPSGVAALVLLAGFAGALGVRARVNHRSMIPLSRLVAAFNAVHASDDATALEALTGRAPQVDAAVAAAKGLTGYLPLTAEQVEQALASKQRRAPADALVQDLCTSALRADVDYTTALARLDAAERIAVSVTPRSVLMKVPGSDEQTVLVSLKQLLGRRPLDAQSARQTLALLAQWEERRQTAPETWGELARLAAAAGSVHDYVRNSRGSVLSYLGTFWFPPEGGPAAVGQAVKAFTADMDRLPPAMLLRRYGSGAYLERVMDEVMNRMVGRPGMGMSEMRNLRAEAESVGTMVDALAAFWADGARLRLLAAALAMRLQQQGNGELPQKLDVVAAGCPVPLWDPFSDALLSVTARDGRTILFSIGPNGLDQGGRGAFSPLEPTGAPQPGGQGEQPDDIALPLSAIPPPTL